MKVFWSLVGVFVLSVTTVWACEFTPYFSPTEDVQAVALKEIQDATTSIHCSLFGITNSVLGDALAAADKRGLDVELALDKTQSAGKASLDKVLKRAGLVVTIKKRVVLEHNKYCVFDGTSVLMGSWNWSNNAQKQDNSDILFKDCPDIAKAFEANYQMIYARDK